MRTWGDIKSLKKDLKGVFLSFKRRYINKWRRHITLNKGVVKLCIIYTDRVIRKVVPTPTSECATTIWPLWYSVIMRLTRVNPRPQPRFFVVKPGLNTSRCWRGVIPLPVSVMSINTFPGFDEMTTDSFPSPSIASMAFLQMFSMTHSKSGGLCMTAIEDASASKVISTFDETRERK